MKAVVIHAARDLRVEEREPEAVGAGQVEVAVEATKLPGPSGRWVRRYRGSRSATASLFLRAGPAMLVIIA